MRRGGQLVKGIHENIDVLQYVMLEAIEGLKGSLPRAPLDEKKL